MPSQIFSLVGQSIEDMDMPHPSQNVKNKFARNLDAFALAFTPEIPVANTMESKSEQRHALRMTPMR
ncbi:hypothetical protein [Flexibacterium corallicola]|uniref:hypothetical protein n=1 Tax=Flexibacterium corallicola TaxID=3037259 RepID=UPI00286EFBEC|nr:hypothetical protein [Pseudovibrio sp. M1P-2-3]